MNCIISALFNGKKYKLEKIWLQHLLLWAFQDHSDDTLLYKRIYLSLLFSDLYRKTQILFSSFSYVEVLLSVLLTFKTSECKNASNVSLIDSYLCKMFSYRFPQPWSGWPDDFAAVLLALPHVLQSWLALVWTVQRQHALLRSRPGH